MSEEKRLTVAFGEFSCEVVGFDDPYKIVAQVVDLFKEYSLREGRLHGEPVDLDALKSAAMANGFAQEAARVDVKGDDDGAHMIVTANADEKAAEPATGEMPPQQEFTATDEPVVETAKAEVAETIETADLGAIEPEADAPGNAEPAALLETTEPAAAPRRRVQTGYSFSMPVFDDPVDKTADEVKAKAEPSESRPLAQDVSAEDDNDNVLFDDLAIDETPKAIDVFDAKPDTTELPVETLNEDDAIIRRAQRAITDFEDIYDDEPEVAPAPAPEKPADRAAKVVKELSSTLRRTDKRPAEPAKAKPPRIQMEMSVAKKPATDTKETEKPVASHDELKKRIKNEPAEEVFAGNFLFDDVPEAEEAAPVSEAVKATPVRSAVTTVEPVVAPAAEQAEPLLLTDPVAASAPAPDLPPLTLTDPIKPAEPAPVLPKLAVQHAAEPKPEPSAPIAAPAEKAAKKAPVVKGGGFERLQEARDAALPQLNEPSSTIARTGEPRLVALSNEGEFDENISAEQFAHHVGATSLQDLLEATAVYMAIVQGRNSFSRREVMQAFNLIGTDREYTQEARLKTFRKLLTTGALVRMDDGEFAISHATRFGYENQLRA